MRTLVILGLMAAAAVPAIAPAQNRDMRDDRREVREEQRDVKRAIRNGAPPRVVREEQRDVREARRDVREDQRDRRGNWQDWRRDHRDDYRRPAYAGPRGYAYRPVAVGYRFQPNYYGQNYWVNDYRRYRLDAPGRNQQWVRYGNDVVRVDTRNGRVLAVNRDFFW